VSANVDERTRFEIYYPPFDASVRSGVLSVMCSYNRINDVHACQNNVTISNLKDTMGFDGWLMSDWDATHSTVDSVLAGLDQEFPIGLYYSNKALNSSLAAGNITEQQLDEKVLRILTAMFSIGLFDSPAAAEGHIAFNVTSDAHNQLAREVAGKATVLVKNDNSLLPFTLESLGGKSCVAVIGDVNTITGGGSGSVSAPYIISPAQGIQMALNQLAEAAGSSPIPVRYDSGTNINSAATLAAECGAAVVVVATNSCEGSDRSTLSLGDAQNNLITSVAAACTTTVAVVRCPGAVLMPWSEQVPAILVSWLGGQEAGNGLADILFGKINPSARLPVTMPNKDNEIGFTPANILESDFLPRRSTMRLC